MSTNNFLVTALRQMALCWQRCFAWSTAGDGAQYILSPHNTNLDPPSGESFSVFDRIGQVADLIGVWLSGPDLSKVWVGRQRVELIDLT